MKHCILNLLSCALLSGSLRAEEPNPPPTYPDVPYGSEARNVLDFWQATGDGPRPLLVYIHGGGWFFGDKKLEVPALRPFLDKGISCASISYRLTDNNPLPAPVRDAVRAIQFLRTKSAEWNIDKPRIALTGASAGACTSMWILLHDDLANGESDDPVQCESSRVVAAAVTNGQTTIDPPVLKEWLGSDVLKHPMIFRAVGEKSIEDALQHYDKHRATFREFSPYNHVDERDPPLYLTYEGASVLLPCGDGVQCIHHPGFGIKMKEKSDQVGHECHLYIEGKAQSEKYANSTEFLMSKMLAP